MHHNLLLQEALEKLQDRYPGITIVYGDLFSPMMEMVELPAKFRKHLTTECLYIRRFQMMLAKVDGCKSVGLEEDILTMCSRAMMAQMYARNRLPACSGMTST
jgi:hypothetical protein